MIDDVLTRAQVARMIQVSLPTLTSLVRKHGLPAHRIGPHAIRFLRSEVICWIGKRKGVNGDRAA